MHQRKFHSRLAAQSTTARRIFDFVPKQEAWPIHYIVRELHRAGISTAPDIIQGCLCALREAGLVKEVHKNSWRAVEVRVSQQQPEAPTDDEDDDVVDQTKKPNEPVVVDTLTSISNEAARLRHQAKELEASAKRLDDIALTIEQQRLSDAAAVRKFEQLRELLK